VGVRGEKKEFDASVKNVHVVTKKKPIKINFEKIFNPFYLIF
jgi:hypothetical protein